MLRLSIRSLRISLAVTLLVACLIPSAAVADEPVVLVLGDSIGAGYNIPAERDWVALMAQRLAEHEPPYRVVNASISGDDSAGALARLPRLLDTHDPALVLVEIGGNDGLRGQPVTSLRANLLEIVRLSRESGARVLLLGMRIPPNYGQRYTEQFHRAYHDVAEQTGVPLVPFLLEGIAVDPALMQDDGIHPNSEAQPLILQNVMPALEEILDEGLDEK